MNLTKYCKDDEDGGVKMKDDWSYQKSWCLMKLKGEDENGWRWRCGDVKKKVEDECEGWKGLTIKMSIFVLIEIGKVNLFFFIKYKGVTSNMRDIRGIGKKLFK